MAETDKITENMFQSILNRCPVGIAVIDYDGIFVTVNPEYCSIYGYTPAQMLGQSFTMVFPEETRAPVLAKHQHFLDEGGRLGGEWTVVRHDGIVLTVWTESVPFPRATGGADRLVYVLNITEQKRNQEQMRIAATVYETSHDAIMVTDAENRLIAVNPAFTRVTGYDFADVSGSHPDIFNAANQEDCLYRDMWRRLHEDSFWIGEVWDRRKNGEPYLKELTLTVVRDLTGKVQNYVGVFSDITERKKNEELIWRQANYDAVTGLPNRHMFHDRLEVTAQQVLRSGQNMALLLIDLDHFKEVNDSLGHNAGDTLLAEVAHRIMRCVRGVDTIARLGGDEFAVIIPELNRPEQAERIARTLLASLSQSFSFEGEAMFVTASIGIAIFPHDSASLEGLLRNADQAMYAAKAAGRNCFSYFTPALQEAALNRMHISNDLRRAISGSQFQVYYQPIVHLHSGRVVKAEALLRWNHPRNGIIEPMRFIPVAEDTGLILQLGDWVAHQAIEQLALWCRSYDPAFQMSINLSPVQFRRNDFSNMDWVRELETRRLEKDALTIEITEGLLLNAEPRVNDNLMHFHEAGIQVAIDDFGTGYSSLAYLQKFDIDYLKIDRSFVEDIDGVGLDLCEAMVVMAHRLGLEVVAEGVETRHQRDMLTEMGCDYAQGFLYSHAVPARAFTSMLETTPVM
jgi:diguanylate cyclase (GGDEF)-like protein/PAS domain S-box-containing protein